MIPFNCKFGPFSTPVQYSAKVEREHISPVMGKQEKRKILAVQKEQNGKGLLSKKPHTSLHKYPLSVGQG